MKIVSSRMNIFLFTEKTEDLINYGFNAAYYAEYKFSLLF